MTWKETLPSGCPPEEASSCQGKLYRFVKQAIPSPEDFISWRAMNPQKDLPNESTECKARGLSVYKDKSDAISQQNRIPYFRKLKIAVSQENPDIGKMASTPSRAAKSHHTLWLFEEVNPESFFSTQDIDIESA
jgi:hypothetical protein